MSALDLVVVMNNADGLTAIGHAKKSSAQACISQIIAQKDLLAPFRTKKMYSFFWRFKREMEAQKRFNVSRHRKIGFEGAMMLDTVLESGQNQETSSFM